MEAIILAGGKGTRLKERVSDVPKPLANVNGRPFIDYIVNQLSECDTIFISAGYRSDQIEAHFSGTTIQVVSEVFPLGTGGAVKHVLQRCKEGDILVYNGDTYVDFDIELLCKFHREKGAAVTILSRDISDAGRYGTLQVQDGRVKAFREKEMTGEGTINAGVYVINKDTFFKQGFPETFSLEEVGFPSLLPYGVFSLKTKGRFIDIGTPSSYDESQCMFGAVQ